MNANNDPMHVQNVMITLDHIKLHPLVLWVLGVFAVNLNTNRISITYTVINFIPVLLHTGMITINAINCSCSYIRSAVMCAQI